MITEFRRLSRVEDQVGAPLQLTVGEMEILRLVTQGLGNESIAQQLNDSVQTVANRIRQIYQKLQGNNRT